MIDHKQHCWPVDILIVSLTVCLLFVISPLNLHASEFKEVTNGTAQVNSYELFYPMVAGVIPVKKTYFLKLIRDKKDELLAFSKFEKAKINLHLSNKRLLEAEQLFLLNEEKLAIKTLKRSRKHLAKAVKLAQKLKKEEEVLSVSLMIAETTAKQRKFLPYLAKGPKEDLSQALEESYNLAQSASQFSDDLLFKFLHGER